jgi:hypothetical protein
LEGTKDGWQCPTIGENPTIYCGGFVKCFTEAWEIQMIKTLRITGIIAAVLAGILFVFPVVFGVRSDKGVEQLLNSSGVVEKFSKSKADKAARDDESAGGGPLVKQAQAFALYLNPPKPKAGLGSQSSKVRPRGSVTANFKLIGTSFSAARPELSLAFIDEPGKGMNFVRQSSQVGHLVIEQIKDGLIVVRDGQRTFEMAVEKSPNFGQPIPALVSSATSPSQPEKGTISKGSSSGSIKKPTLRTTSRSVNRANMPSITGEKSSESQLNEEQSAALERFIDRLKTLEKNKSDKIDYNEPNSADSEDLSLSDSTDEYEEQNEQLEEIISDYQSERVSEEEAENLNDLGEELQDVNTEE